MYALSIIDRYYIYHERSPTLAGLYSIAVKLAGAVAFIVRAFQYAWPPLAYSVTDDAEAARLYGLVATYYVLISGWVVAGLTLLGRWVLRLLTAPAYFDAYRALPWLALGWALYGLWVVFLVIAGRAKVTTRNFPAALAGLVANVVLIVAARAAAWDRRGRHRAVRGLRRDARGHARAHAPRVHGQTSSGGAWRRSRSVMGGGRRRGRPAAAHPRGGRAADPRRGARRDPGRAVDDRIRASAGARQGARAARPRAAARSRG